ncbi:MAG: hypothetical protein Q9201_007374 [Fulgogasparrea decipioides]
MSTTHDSHPQAICVQRPTLNAHGKNHRWNPTRDIAFQNPTEPRAWEASNETCFSIPVPSSFGNQNRPEVTTGSGSAMEDLRSPATSLNTSSTTGRLLSSKSERAQSSPSRLTGNSESYVTQSKLRAGHARGKTSQITGKCHKNVALLTSDYYILCRLIVEVASQCLPQSSTKDRFHDIIDELQLSNRNVRKLLRQQNLWNQYTRWLDEVYLNKRGRSYMNQLEISVWSQLEADLAHERIDKPRGLRGDVWQFAELMKRYYERREQEHPMDVVIKRIDRLYSSLNLLESLNVFLETSHVDRMGSPLVRTRATLLSIGDSIHNLTYHKVLATPSGNSLRPNLKRFHHALSNFEGPMREGNFADQHRKSEDILEVPFKEIPSQLPLPNSRRVQTQSRKWKASTYPVAEVVDDLMLATARARKVVSDSITASLPVTEQVNQWQSCRAARQCAKTESPPSRSSDSEQSRKHQQRTIRSLKHLMIALASTVKAIADPKITNPLRLFELETEDWKEHFIFRFHQARANTRIREDCNTFRRGEKIQGCLSLSQVSERLLIYPDFSAAFTHSRSDLFGRWHVWVFFRNLYGLKTHRKGDMIFRKLHASIKYTSAQISELLRELNHDRNRVPYSKRQIHASAKALYREMLKVKTFLIWSSSGHRKKLNISPKMIECMVACRRSSNVLLRHFNWLCDELKATPRPSSMILAGSLGHYMTYVGPPETRESRLAMADDPLPEAKGPSQLPLPNLGLTVCGQLSEASETPLPWAYDGLAPATARNRTSSSANITRPPSVTESTTRQAQFAIKAKLKKPENEVVWDSPDYVKTRRLCTKVVGSWFRLYNIIRLIKTTDSSLSIRLRLAEVEMRLWMNAFVIDAHWARVFVRLREEWDAVLQGRKVKRWFSVLELSEHLRYHQRNVTASTFIRSWKELVTRYAILAKYRALHTLKRGNPQGIFRKLVATSQHMRQLMRQSEDNRYNISNHQLSRSSNELDRAMNKLNGVLFLVPQTQRLVFCMAKLKRSRLSLYTVMKDLYTYLGRAPRTSGNIFFSGSLGDYLVDHGPSGVRGPSAAVAAGLLPEPKDLSESEVQQIESPMYLNAEGGNGTNGDDLRADSAKYWAQNTWPKIPYYQSLYPSAGAEQGTTMCAADDTLGHSYLQPETQVFPRADSVQLKSPIHLPTVSDRHEIRTGFPEQRPQTQWPGIRDVQAKRVSVNAKKSVTKRSLEEGFTTRTHLQSQRQDLSAARNQRVEPPKNLPGPGAGGIDISSGRRLRWTSTAKPITPYFQSSSLPTDRPGRVTTNKPRGAALHTSTGSTRPQVDSHELAIGLGKDHANLAVEDDKIKSHGGSPLGYHIPSVKMRESMLASRTSRSAYWQYTLYEGPKGEKVKVHYCKSLETTERIAKLFVNESVIGFDIEWKPSATAKDGIRKNVALIQIASEERIALFHVARFSKDEKIEDLVAPTFKTIMESDSITKVGVSVKGDCSRLRKYMSIESRGLFELSHLYKLVKFCVSDVKRINKMLVALAKQVEEHLMLPMYKDESVRGSDWSEDLNYEQIYCKMALPPSIPDSWLTRPNRRSIRLLRRPPALSYPQQQTPSSRSPSTTTRSRRAQLANPSRKRPNRCRVRRTRNRGASPRIHYFFALHRANSGRCPQPSN